MSKELYIFDNIIFFNINPDLHNTKSQAMIIF